MSNNQDVFMFRDLELNKKMQETVVNRSEEKNLFRFIRRELVNHTLSGASKFKAMLQAVDNMLQGSKKALEQIDYHKSVISESEKMMETLNPQYAENKQQARTIKDLQERADKQDKKLDDIYSLLQKISGAPPKA